jgi:hypothetical protein
MASNEEDNPVELKVEEVGVLQQKEQNEEEEEEEGEQEEVNDQKPQNPNQNNQENNDEEEGEEEGKMEIKLVKEKDDDQIDDDENKQSFDIDLEPELKVTVEWYITGNNYVDILFKTMSKQKLWLHWGVSQGNDGKNWSRIEKSYYPALTYEFQETSLQTEFSYLEQDDLEQKIHIRFPKTHVHSFNFVFLEKEKNKWYNNNEQDYHLQIN